MPKYKVTIVETTIYDCEVEADSLDEAKEIAIDNESDWVADSNAGWTELGEDHRVLVEGEWVIA
jgi:hypothetical protein